MEVKFEHEEQDYYFAGGLKNSTIKLNLEVGRRRLAKTLKYKDFPSEIQKAYDCVQDVFEALRKKESYTVDLIKGAIIMISKAIKKNKVIEIVSVIELGEVGGSDADLERQRSEIQELRKKVEEMEPLTKLVEAVTENTAQLREEQIEEKRNFQWRFSFMQEEIGKIKQLLKPLQKTQMSSEIISKEEFEFQDIDIVLQEATKFKDSFKKIESIKKEIHLKGNFLSGKYRGELKDGKPNGLGILLASKKSLTVFAQWQNGEYHGRVLEEISNVWRWSEYKHGERHGKKIDFKNGKLKSEYNYENGSLCGKYRIYKQDGSVKEEGRVVRQK